MDKTKVITGHLTSPNNNNDLSSVVSQDEHSQYKQSGFFVKKHLIPPEKLEQYKNRFREIANKQLKIPGLTVMKDVALVKSGREGEYVVNKIQDFQFDDNLFEFCKLPQIVNVVKEMVGPNVMAMHTMLINKPPDPGSLTSRHPLHQDLHYFPFRPADRIICAWAALEPVTVDNGCLFVVPGSHIGPLYPHTYPDWEGGVNKMYHGVQDCPDSPVVQLEMDPGDVVFFHSVLLHGSGANKTTGFRKAISCHYAASECQYIDVRGTSQENISDEVLLIAKKRYGNDVEISFEDTWRYRARLVAGERINL